MDIDPAAQARGRRRLIAMFLFFFVPFFGAWIWFANIESWRPMGTSNNGELIEPAVPLREPRVITHDGRTIGGEDLERRWLLVHVAAGTCEEKCQRNLYHTRQIRVGLGKDVQRVQRMLLLDGETGLNVDELTREHPQLLVGSDDALATAIRAATKDMSAQPDAFYLVDPLLNLMMRFSPDLDPRLVLKDLKKLLKISRIG